MISFEAETEALSIVVKIIHYCFKESCFPDCRKVSSVFFAFKNVGERSVVKNYCSLSLLSVVSICFEKLLNNRFVDHIEKCGLFLDFQDGFWSSHPTQTLR